MNNYYTHLVWVTDQALLCLAVFAGLFTIFYSLAKEYFWKRRSRALLSIKKNIYELAISGGKTDNKVCLPAVSEITPQQFLDVATNRNREVAFFNESEQKILKGCFILAEKLAEIEKIARFSWKKWQRVEAILTLGYAQAESSLNTLKETINDQDLDISYFSIIALGQVKNVPSARILLDFIRKSSFYRYRIFSLLEFFPAETADEVISLVDSPDPGIRSWAIKLICRLKALQYSEKIRELALDKTAQVRAVACDCLGEFGEKDSQVVIAKCLNDDSWMVRVSAVKALFKVAGKDGLAAIMERINDGSLSVIESIKEMMAANIEICLPYVIEFLYGDDEMARRVSVEVLEASGYILKLFRNLLTGNEKEIEIAGYLLKGLIVSRAFAGLEASLLSLAKGEQGRVLAIIKNIDEETAAILENSAADHQG